MVTEIITGINFTKKSNSKLEHCFCCGNNSVALEYDLLRRGHNISCNYCCASLSIPSFYLHCSNENILDFYKDLKKFFLKKDKDRNEKK